MAFLVRVIRLFCLPSSCSRLHEGEGLVEMGSVLIPGFWAGGEMGVRWGCARVWWLVKNDLVSEYLALLGFLRLSACDRRTDCWMRLDLIK